MLYVRINAEGSGLEPMTLSKPRTVRQDRLRGLDTAELIGQYDLAVSSSRGRYSNTAPRQKRINFIVDILSARADAGDEVAGEWLDA